MNNSKAISILFGSIVGLITTLTAFILGVDAGIKLVSAAIISFSTSTLLFAIITENLFDKKIKKIYDSFQKIRNKEFDTIAGDRSLLKEINPLKGINTEIFDYAKLKQLEIDELKRNSIDQVFMLYPDPWPKKKHFKRRLISKIFLKRLHKILKKNGMTLISTDYLSYLYAIFYEFSLNPNFEWANKDAADYYKRPLEMIKSKYERKADIERNDKYFLKFKKIC